MSESTNGPVPVTAVALVVWNSVLALIGPAPIAAGVGEESPFEIATLMPGLVASGAAACVKSLAPMNAGLQGMAGRNASGTLPVASAVPSTSETSGCVCTVPQRPGAVSEGS